MNRVFNTARLRKSVSQEKRIAKDVAGRRVAGSGNMPGNKGDVRADKWLIEAKRTIATHYNLRLSDWRKIFSEAVRAGKEPVMVVEIAGRSVAVIDYQTWLGLKSLY